MATRTEGYPSLTAREHWGKYFLGIVLEVVFILGLGLVAFLLAVVAMRIW